MEALQPLSSQAHAVRVGEPLPFGICDAEGRLLLARGQVLQSQGQLEGLLDRGAFIHRDHAAEAVERIRAARPQELPRLWSESAQQLGRVLKAQLDPHFEASLERAARPVVALVQRDPDMAILQVVQPPDTPVSNYANRHALHSAIAGQLAAQRLGWGDDAGKSLFRAALTMNLGMAELQNRLAAQVTPLTALQRQQLHEHPQRSVEILQTAGVNDALWLEAVAQHHERPDGQGYPRGLGDLGELALLLNRVDAFTARFSARVIRQAMPADAAVRQFFAADPKSPHAAAIVKEFGLYPPGCSVRLKSGEAGIVMRRGATATTPVVAVLTTRNGDPLMQPVKRDTQQAENAVAAVLPAAAIKVRLPVEKLVACCAH
jgi:HD-GYP domain-containing protein (c-di-GMP phosphodiesterase class II)